MATEAEHWQGWWHGGFLTGALAALLMLPAAMRAEEVAAFGTNQRGAAALVGIFYDLKQTQQREPIPGNGRDYAKFIDDFIVAGFDEALFNRFFRAGMPLYTTQVATGRMNAEAAPKAFGVEAVVKPRAWVVHYKAQVSPPADGTYRFVGAADDMMVVAVNRRVVLVGNLPSTAFPRLGWKALADQGPKPAAHTGAKYGDWIDLRADKPVDLDILIGERPGGIFNALLLYEKKGETYPLTSKGEIILPLFQVAPLPMNETRFLTDRAPWKCLD
ncbi:hypothetical protein [Rariglobus hedericola]|uniref:PA14 domain-containing protein n=1 Tax=Rariglobus hedericola TaxID=2597822 RepID=A0A556QSD1_9BACT|nr:hypothetical protein [Rariglobus hedericola]TSJ79546.1 hypothetical protein FPL22_09750 [Rariglobus hedericola]